MLRRSEPDAIEQGPRWILTFNDIMTLLLTFFVLVLSMSSLDAGAVRTIHQEILSTLGGTSHQKDSQAGPRGIPAAVERVPITAPTTAATSRSAAARDSDDPSLSALARALQDLFKVPLSDELREQQEKADARGTARKFHGAVDEHYYEPGVVLLRQGRDIVLRVPGTVLFESGEAELSPQASGMLDAVAGVLARTDANILIEGHTDSMPVATGRYPSNWELSVARAARVARYLVEKHSISPQRIGVSGYADRLPLVPNDTPRQRELNRRVEIVFTRG